jgi:hypothetical protein
MRLLLRFSAIVLFCLAAPRSVSAQLEIGTWVRKSTANQPTMTLKIETCCGHIGRKLTYSLTGATMTLASGMDGRDAALSVNGKPTGETMAITRVDAHHATTVIKMNGAKIGTSTATLSDDGKTLTIESELTTAAGGNRAGKQTEVWVKQ